MPYQKANFIALKAGKFVSSNLKNYKYCLFGISSVLLRCKENGASSDSIKLFKKPKSYFAC